MKKFNITFRHQTLQAMHFFWPTPIEKAILDVAAPYEQSQVIDAIIKEFDVGPRFVHACDLKDVTWAQIDETNHP